MSDVKKLFAAYLDGSMIFAEFEARLTKLATDDVAKAEIVALLSQAFAADRVPSQIYHTLSTKFEVSKSAESEPTIRTNIDSAPEIDEPTLKADAGREDQLTEVTIQSQGEVEWFDDADEATVSDDETRTVESQETRVVTPPVAGLPDEGVVHQFPSSRGADSSKSGTGSNWGRPEEWTDKHTGPVQVGSIIKNRFQIESQLGQGGMGVVFKARDRRKDEAQDSDPFVAIKILNEDFKAHPRSLIALQREATKAQTLAHPNIVTVYDFDRDGTTVYMTMELMRGSSLSQYIRGFRKGGATRDEAAPIIMAMAAGLAYAHERDIVHSDFKPGNVFVTDDNRVKILDFGIARATQEGGQSTSSDHFDAGELGAMTPGYASLEMQRGEPPHPADDVYALAVTAYQLLTGDHPFNRKTARQALEEGLKPTPIKGLKRREWKAIERGLAFHRKDRIQTAGEFLTLYRGASTVRKSMYGALAASLALAAFFGYQSLQDRPGPFPEDRRAEFEDELAAAVGMFRAVDNDSSATDVSLVAAFFAEPYEIHPRNPEVVDWLQQVAKESIGRADSGEELEIVVGNLICNGNLGEYKPLMRACESLGDPGCEEVKRRRQCPEV